MKLVNLTADKLELLVKEAIKVAENFDPRNNINKKFNFIELDQVNRTTVHLLVVKMFN